MLQSVMNTSTPIQTAIRTVFVTMDVGVYYLLHFVYELIFTIASINLLDREMIYNIFSRVQLVIGIFMMFRLIMIILKGIASPDTVSDSKSGGAGSLVMRIIVSLALLALIVPVSVPSPKNEYEKQINNNGILFGTLYSLQYRLLKNNTLGKLILGDTNQESTNETTEIMGYEVFGLRRDANRFTSTILKTFYQLNKDSETNQYVCGDGFDETYNKEDVEPAVIIVNAVQTCGTGNAVVDAVDNAVGVATMGMSKSGQQYRLTINWLSTIVGIILLVVFFMLAFNVATRVFKLSALQLIAPIPIISYMDPKGSKDGAFQAWVKMLGTTYAELFIQLGVIYFSLSVINAFITRFFNVENAATAIQEIGMGDPLTATALIGFIFIIMVIALFIFAKDAPKFFKQMLGIKDDGKGFFSSFGTAMGLGVSAVGAATGSFRASRDASVNSIRERAKQHAKDRGWDAARTNQYIQDQLAANRGRSTLAGIVGAGAGFAQGANAAFNAKGGGFAKAAAAINAQNNRNSRALAAGRAGGGFFGAIGSGVEQFITGESPYDKMLAGWQEQENELKNRELKLKESKDQKGHLEANLNRHKSKSEDCTWTTGKHTINGITVEANYRDFNSASTKDNNIVHIKKLVDLDENGNQRTTLFSLEEYKQLPVELQVECKDESYMDYHGVHIPLDQVESFRIGLKDSNDKDRAAKTSECAIRVMDLMHDGLTKEQAIVRAKEDMKVTEFMASDPTLSAADARTRAQQYVHDHDEDVYDDSVYNHMLAYRNSRIAEILASPHVENPGLTSQDIINADYAHRHRANPADGAVAPYDIDMPITLGALKGAIGKIGAHIDAENDAINRESLQVNEAKRRVEATAAQKNRDYFSGSKK